MLLEEILSLLETAINRLLKLDPKSDSYFIALKDKKIEFCIAPCEALYLHFFPDYVAIEKGQSLIAEASVKGPIQAFLCWLITKDQHQAQMLGLQIEGDGQVLEKFQHIVLQLSIDWEELFSQISNDEIAHSIYQFLQKHQSNFQSHSAQFITDLKAYLEDEIQLIVPKVEIELFNEQVDELRDTISRLEARVMNLESNNESH